jgi:hypothetical protein
MPALLSHTHCQAPQANAKSKACQRVCLSNRTDGKINNEGTTHNIANKGLRDLRRFVTRFNFSYNLLGNRPQSLTGHIVKRNKEIHFAFKN